MVVCIKPIKRVYAGGIESAGEQDRFFKLGPCDIEQGEELKIYDETETVIRLIDNNSIIYDIPKEDFGQHFVTNNL